MVNLKILYLFSLIFLRFIYLVRTRANIYLCTFGLQCYLARNYIFEEKKLKFHIEHNNYLINY